MADTSPAQSSAHAAPTPSSPRVEEDANSESAPLLLQDPAPAEATDPSTDPEANTSGNASEHPVPKTHIVILTSLSLALSLISLIFIAATYIFIAKSKYYIYFYWFIDDAIRTIVPITIIAAISSVINLLRLLRSRARAPLPLPLNIILDIIILVYGLGAAGSGLSGIADRSSINCNYPAHADQCKRLTEVAQILLAVGFGAALGVGIVHLVLFVLRVVEAYKTRFWRQGSRSGLRFPTGTFSVEFTIRLLRQERGEGEGEGQIRI